MSRLEALVEKFRGVAAERLARLRTDVSSLEGDTDSDAHERVTRELHTLKGEAGMLGFRAVSRVAYGLEELLPRVGGHPEAQDLLHRGFELIDRMRALPPDDGAAAAEAEDFVRSVSALDP